MKKLICLTVLACISHQLLFAQQWAPVDKSPLDQIYYPQDYPSLKIKGTNEPLRMRVIYSRPNKNGRKVFGSDIVPLGKVWRLGANEATELHLFSDAKIGGKKIAAGRYTLYAIVNEDSWTYIINKETDTWGAFKYSASKDVCRVTVPTQKIEQPIEALTIELVKKNNIVNLVVGWDMVTASLPIIF